jgi:hypothetical protein
MCVTLVYLFIHSDSRSKKFPIFDVHRTRTQKRYYYYLLKNTGFFYMYIWIYRCLWILFWFPMNSSLAEERQLPAFIIILSFLFLFFSSSFSPTGCYRSKWKGSERRAIQLSLSAAVLSVWMDTAKDYIDPPPHKSSLFFSSAYSFYLSSVGLLLSFYWVVIFEYFAGHSAEFPQLDPSGWSRRVSSTIFFFFDEGRDRARTTPRLELWVQNTPTGNRCISYTVFLFWCARERERDRRRRKGRL